MILKSLVNGAIMIVDTLEYVRSGVSALNGRLVVHQDIYKLFFRVPKIGHNSNKHYVYTSTAVAFVVCGVA